MRINGSAALFTDDRISIEASSAGLKPGDFPLRLEVEINGKEYKFIRGHADIYDGEMLGMTYNSLSDNVRLLLIND